MSHAISKQEKLDAAKRLLLTHENGVSVMELSKTLEVNYSTAWRYMQDLGAVETGEKTARYTLTPTPEDVELALAVLNRVNWKVPA
jgi:DNA-binding IclR family transcriptional regulator